RQLPKRAMVCFLGIRSSAGQDPHSTPVTLTEITATQPSTSHTVNAAIDHRATISQLCRRLLLVLLPLVLAVAWPVSQRLAGLGLDASTAVLLAGDARTSAAYEKLTKYVGDDLLVALLVEHDDVFSNEGAALLYDIGDALEDLPAVIDVKSLAHSRRPIRRGLSFDPREMFGAVPFIPRAETSASQWAELRSFTLAYPLARDVFVSLDGKLAVVMCQIERRDASVSAVLAVIEDVALRHEARSNGIHLLGFPFVEAEVAGQVGQDTVFFVVAAAMLTLLVLLVAFRSPWVLLTILLLEAVGTGLVFVLLQWNGATLNLYTGILVPLVAGVQLTFLTHFFVAAQQDARSGFSASVVLRSALSRVWKPSAIAAATTIVGLLSLTLCDVGLVRQFGAVGAQAVALVLLVSFGPGWIASRLWRSSADHSEARGLVSGSTSGPPAASAAMVRWHSWLGRHRLAILVFAVLLMILAIPGILSLRTDVRAVEYLAEDSPSRHALTLIDEDLGGMNFFALAVDTGRVRGMHSRESLEFLEQLRAYGEAQPAVTHVYAFSQIFSLLNQVWDGDDPASLRLPESNLRLALFSTAVSTYRLPLQSMLTDAESRVARVIVRSRDLGAAEYLALIDRFQQFAAEELPEGMSLKLEAGVHSLLAADRRMVASLVKSLASCLLAVAVTLVLLLRSWRLGLSVLVVNVLPLATILAVMGFSGLPLNSVTVMVSAVALGVAVDDAIHVVAALAAERRRLAALDEAQGHTLSPVDLQARQQGTIAAVYSAKVRPVAATSAILTGGFLLFLFSSFPPVADFGLLAALGLAVAMATVLVVLPLLLPRHSKSEPAGLQG
ncbi:MAG: putative RND superfamily exporter protein, partial [Pseudohongiellaceae bacterium]